MCWNYVPASPPDAVPASPGRCVRTPASTQMRSGSGRRRYHVATNSSSRGRPHGRPHYSIPPPKITVSFTATLVPWRRWLTTLSCYLLQQWHQIFRGPGLTSRVNNPSVLAPGFDESPREQIVAPSPSSGLDEHRQHHRDAPSLLCQAARRSSRPREPRQDGGHDEPSHGGHSEPPSSPHASPLHQPRRPASLVREAHS